jgi:hypothetical protein
MWDSLGELFGEVFSPTMQPEPIAGESHFERFERFHSLNPHVYEAIASLVRQLKRRGHKRISMRGLFEFLRTSHALQTAGDDYKLNNNFTSFYARLIAVKEPELASLFEFRRCVA